MVILVNERTYGGGGIYNLYTTVSVDNKFGEYIMVHEFGHHMGALADEYYTSSIAYEQPKITAEPWETNITALFDASNLKWKDLVEEGTLCQPPGTRNRSTGSAMRSRRNATAFGMPRCQKTSWKRCSCGK